jgi:hypothetical protein
MATASELLDSKPDLSFHMMVSPAACHTSNVLLRWVGEACKAV